LIDIDVFDQVHILTLKKDKRKFGSDSLIIAETGYKTGNIVHKTMIAGLTVPLETCPSIDTGL